MDSASLMGKIPQADRSPTALLFCTMPPPHTLLNINECDCTSERKLCDASAACSCTSPGRVTGDDRADSLISTGIRRSPADTVTSESRHGGDSAMERRKRQTVSVSSDPLPELLRSSGLKQTFLPF